MNKYSFYYQICKKSIDTKKHNVRKFICDKNFRSNFNHKVS